MSVTHIGYELRRGSKRPKQPEPQKHEWCDGWMKAVGPALKRLADDTQRLISHHEGNNAIRARRRRPEDEEHHCRRVEALVCSLAHAVLVPPPTGRIAVKLGHGRKGRTRYDSPVFGKPLSVLAYMLAEIDILHLQTSSIRGEVSSIAPTNWFSSKVREYGVHLADFGRHEDEELISLTRNVRKYTGWAEDRVGTLYRERIDYTDTRLTRKYRRELRALNDHLRSADIDFLDDGLEPRIDPYSRRLRRHFIILKDQDERFDQGGRLFGGFWDGLKRQRRGQIRIQGEPVAILDYSSMFTRLAYADIGAVPPAGDLYAIPGFEGYRSGIKVAMNTLLFDGHQSRSRWPKEIGIGVGSDTDAAADPLSPAAAHHSRLPPGSTVATTKSAILKVHSELEKAWGRRLGYQLMFRESEVLLSVLQELACKRITALGLHDGLMVPLSAAREAQRVMKQVAQCQCGLEMPVTLNT